MSPNDVDPRAEELWATEIASSTKIGSTKNEASLRGC
jgi:hypothetical protein